MNRLARFRFGNLHKRRIFLVIVLVTLILLTSMLFLMFIGFFGSRAELPRVRASAELTSKHTEGVGINVLEVPDANLIDNPFFGKCSDNLSAQITEVSGNSIYFDPSDASEFSGLTFGDSVEILSMDASGRMGLRYSGTAVGFTDTVFGVPVALEDTAALWINDPVVQTAEYSDVLYLLTANGNLITDAAVYPELSGIGQPVIDICSEGMSVYAVTSIGEIYVSTDSGPFSLLGSCNLTEDKSVNHIESVNGNVVVFLSDGSIVTLDSSGCTAVRNADVTYTVSGSGYLAYSSGDEIYVSRNGLFFLHLEEFSSYIREGDMITDMKAGADGFYVLTNYGRLIRIDMSDEQPVITSCDISSIEPVSICASGDDAVIAVTSDSQAYYVPVSTGVPRSLGLTGISVDCIMNYGGDSYLIKSGNTLYESSLKSAVYVDVPVPDGVVMEGDTCIVEHMNFDSDSWDLYGDTHLITQSRGVSLVGSGDGVHAMSFELNGSSAQLFESNLFYRIEVTMSSDTEDASCYVWLNGETFGEQGLHITDLNGQQRSYSFVFAVTENMLSDETLRFNISFENDAVINIYDAYVGLDRYDINSVPSDFTDEMAACAPSALRFSSTVPGSNGFCEETYYGISAFSLERELLLCKNSGANPWIVMSSSVSQNDVNEFLGYLCGSVSNDYGKRRIDNGSALPWSRQFDTIYIEISDLNGTFLTDSQRGAYVSYVMSLFAKSEFYIEIKDRIVFIDGMNYEGGVMLSDADRHASGIVIDIAEEEGEELSFIDSVYSAIDNLIYNAPRNRNGGSSGGEFVSTVRIGNSVDQETYDSADIVSAIIRAENMYADLIMIDSDMPSCRLIASLRPLIGGDLMYCETMEPLDQSSRFTAEGFNEACETLLIDQDESIVIVLANHSEELQQFVVLSDAYNTSDGSYRRYSARGDLLMERDLDRLGLRLVLQAGEYMVIEIPK